MSRRRRSARAAARCQRRTPPSRIPHLALLLPLASNALARHAEAVSNGFLAAARTQGGAPLPVHVYATGDDAQSVIDEYRKALAAGARVIVGPLTRSAVTAIATSAMVMVPTLALNVPDQQVGTPPGFYMLSLQIEAEARQVAQLAFQRGPPQRADRERRHPAPEAHPPGFRRGIHAPRRRPRRGPSVHAPTPAA